LALGGAERQTLFLASVLRSAGVEVSLLSIIAPTAFVEDAQALQIPIVSLKPIPGARALTAIAQATQYLRSVGPAAVISFVYQSNILGRVAGRAARVPVIISSIRNERFGGRGRELLMRGTDRLCTLTTTNSTKVALELTRRGVVAADRIRVIPNAIDAERFRATAAERQRSRRALGLTDEFAFLAIGRLEMQKDFPTLLQAVDQCIRNGIRVKVLIVGDGTQREKLESQSFQLGLQESVEFLGPRSDIPLLVASADGVVLASRWEGVPNALMEGMAAGVPFVATDVGGVSELACDGRAGFLARPQDPHALAREMARLVGMPESDRRAMGTFAQCIVESRYSHERVGGAWLDLLAGLTNRANLKAH
jgi:glycosyltransferase involved in cell wall biosynthesis